LTLLATFRRAGATAVHGDRRASQNDVFHHESRANSIDGSITTTSAYTTSYGYHGEELFANGKGPKTWTVAERRTYDALAPKTRWTIEQRVDIKSQAQVTDDKVKAGIPTTSTRSIRDDGRFNNVTDSYLARRLPWLGSGETERVHLLLLDPSNRRQF